MKGGGNVIFRGVTGSRRSQAMTSTVRYIPHYRNWTERGAATCHSSTCHSTGLRAMAVKDLVQLYESSPSPSRADRLRHPLLRLTSPQPSRSQARSRDSVDTLVATATPLSPHSVTTNLLPSYEKLDESHTNNDGESDALHELPSYPPRLTKTVPISRLGSNSSSSTLVTRKNIQPHTPVAATIVFARKAAPLYLPSLDVYLSSISPPSFSSSKHDGKQAVMFPPMDLLESSGSTIEDLELNSQVAPWWRNRNTLLGSSVNVVLGLTVRLSLT